MIVTRGYGSSLIPTRGYGPIPAPPLSEIDTSSKGLKSRTVASLTRSRTAILSTKRTVSDK